MKDELKKLEGVTTKGSVAAQSPPEGGVKPLFKKPKRPSIVVTKSPIYKLPPTSTESSTLSRRDSGQGFNNSLFPPGGESFFDSDSPLPCALKSFTNAQQSGGEGNSPGGRFMKSKFAPSSVPSRDISAAAGRPSMTGSISEVGSPLMASTGSGDHAADFSFQLSNFGSDEDMLLDVEDNEVYNHIPIGPTSRNGNKRSSAPPVEELSCDIEAFDSEYPMAGLGQGEPPPSSATQFIASASTQAVASFSTRNDSSSLGMIFF